MAARASSVRLRVAAVITDGTRVLLVRHAAGGRTYHLLPGGGVEPGESLAEALTREVAEETGIACEVGAPLFISDTIDPAGGRHMVQIAFAATPTSTPEAHVSSDRRVVGAEWAEIDVLASMDLRPPMAGALEQAATEGFNGPARYLGALWVDEHSVTGTDDSAEADV